MMFREVTIIYEKALVDKIEKIQKELREEDPRVPESLSDFIAGLAVIGTNVMINQLAQKKAQGNLIQPATRLPDKGANPWGRPITR